ncbi:MAG: 50S ribosomal protein L13 [Spirochaetales bacterium]|jgi:large subunit ribosomal protein L13|nr:50S ribosomal protein L13 [Spirochaetales bacterium]
METIYVDTKKANRRWYLIDASGKRLGRVAVQAVNLLRGKGKPFFTPFQELGDYVVIINAAKAEVTGGKENKKIYYRHSSYPGGLTGEVYKDVLVRKPTFPMEAAVKGMLPHNSLGRKLFKNLKVYPGAEHPHAAQQPEIIA